MFPIGERGDFFVFVVKKFLKNLTGLFEKDEELFQKVFDVLVNSP